MVRQGSRAVFPARRDPNASNVACERAAAGPDQLIGPRRASSLTGHATRTARADPALIADDHRLVRAGMTARSPPTPGLTWSARSPTGSQALRLAEAVKPEVILMGLRMPGTDGVTAIAELVSVTLLLAWPTSEPIPHVGDGGGDDVELGRDFATWERGLALGCGRWAHRGR